jgi:hypothetical protein
VSLVITVLRSILFLHVILHHYKFILFGFENSWTHIAMGFELDDREFESRQGLGIFLFTTASRMALGPTQPPIQWTPGALSLRVKRPRRDPDHSPSAAAEVRNVRSYTSTPQYAFMAWCSVKAQGQLYLYLLATLNVTEDPI